MKKTIHTHYLLPALIIIFIAGSAFAGSATWSTSPATNDWNTATNWTPQTVPNGPSDVATFGVSNTTSIITGVSEFDEEMELKTIEFNPGASAYTITARPRVPASLFITIGGAGIINNSGVTQHFVTQESNLGYSGEMVFENNASAGNATVLTFNGDSFGALFRDNSNAGSATLNHNPNGGLSGASSVFHDNSSAGSATINLYGGTDTADAGSVVFFADDATAGNATITAYGSSASDQFRASQIFFRDNSSTGNATLIAYGGSGGGLGGEIRLDNSGGGTARIEVFDNGQVFAYHTIGSIEGTGNVSLGNSTVGSNNLSTVFSGVMRDAFDFLPGSLTKTGTGTLVLSGANTYTGGTTVNGGVLQVDNTSASGTGTGPVTVNSGGKLAGTGTIAGNVTNNGVVAPGDSPGTLHLGGNFFQSSAGNLEIEIASLFSFDQLLVSGTASVKGGLLVTLDGYIAHEGDIFTILTSSGLTGNFGRFALPTLGDGLVFEESTTANSVLLTVTEGTTNVPDSGSTLLLMACALAGLLGLQRLILSHAKPI